ncbi:hypothetical protein VTO42DRAFT_5204 [Malbranchea cinnamomea]
MASETFQTKAIPKPAPGAGTGLFATTTIYPGFNVCDLPTSFATVLDSARLEDTCSNCFGVRSIKAESNLGEAANGLKLCTGCRTVRYCDRTCQVENWKAAHKYECAIYRDLYPKVLPVNSRAVMRLVLLRAVKRLSQKDIDIFEKDLQSHIKAIEQTNKEQFERLVLSAKAVHSYSKTDMHLNTIVDYFAKLEINSFNLTTPFHDRIGLCIQPYASFINHSCDPNAVVGFDQGRIFIKALREIKSGEQVFISYVDNTNPFELRQKELLERYFFECTCPKCAMGTSAREDRFLVSQPDIPSLKEAEKNALELLESAKRDSNPAAAIEKLKSSVKILQKTEVWPITRQPFVQLRDELIASLIEGQQFGPAFIQSAIRYLRIDPTVFPGTWHPLRNVHAWTLVKLAIHIFEDPNVANADTALIREYGINLGLIIYSVLSDLNKAEGELPTAEMTYKGNYIDVKKEFEANGLKPDTMKSEINAEWAKLEKLVNDTLRGDIDM